MVMRMVMRMLGMVTKMMRTVMRVLRMLRMVMSMVIRRLRMLRALCRKGLGQGKAVLIPKQLLIFMKNQTELHV